MNDLRKIFLIITALLMCISSAEAREVVLDRQVRAGDLILFQSARNSNEYFYAADKTRLAVDAEGQPQFSFLRYVESNVSAEVDNDTAAGGGIVHALVELGVTDDQLADARAELRRVNASGVILGPVAFKSGTFALISSFAKEGSEFTDHVLGVGKAPLLENEKAAVSLSLSRRGAEILWESFRTGAPDISFSFNMEMEGYSSPREASIKADFEKVYQHQNFAAGVATPYLQAEIKAAFDELRDTGAIEITQVGEDAQMESLISTAYDRLTAMMFAKADSSGTPSVAQLAAATGGTDSMLSKASALLETRRSETREENKAARARNERAANARAKVAAARAASEESQQRASSAESGADQLIQRAEAARSTAQIYRTKAEAAQSDEERANFNGLAEEFEKQASSYEGIAEQRTQDASDEREQIAEHNSEVESVAEVKDEEIQALPSLAIVASYQMRKIKQTGKFTIDLNKYAADSLSLRFDENIGDLTRYMDDTDVFKTVDISISSPFPQREIPVFVDGLNAADFGQYVNFVTVALRKKHENGQVTTDEIRIDRSNFQQTANNFKLSYRKGSDTSDQRFQEYEYRVLWNFFGGSEVDEPWRSSIRSGINVVPPYQRRTVFLEGNPEAVADANIRSVEVMLFFKLGDREQSRRISLRPRNGQGLSDSIDFMLPADSYDYEYEINWRLADGERASTGRVPSNESTLYIDEVKEG